MASNRKSNEGLKKMRMGHRGSGDAPAEGFDEFGILRAVDRSSDSAPIDDPSLHLTDDDTSGQVLETVETSDFESPATKDHYRIGTTSDSEPFMDYSNTSGNVGLSDFRSQIDDLAADLTGGSEDISKASDGQTLKKKTASNDSASQQQDETESLTEFEEIERLIQANTVDDSDADLSDIPQDLEQKILSGRKSRESNKSDSRSEENVLDVRKSSCSYSSSSSSSSSSSDEEPAAKKSEMQKQHHQDTGYASEGFKSPDAPGQSFVQNGSPDHPYIVEESADSIAPLQSWLNDPEEEPLHSTGRIPSQENLNNLFTGAPRHVSSSSSTSENEVEATNEGNHGATADEFMIPTQRTDTHQPNSLVATFGTTEEFRDLLIRQLDDMGTEEIPDEEKPAEDHFKEDERQSMAATKRKKLPQQPLPGGSSPNRSRASPRASSSKGQYQMKPQSRNKLRLSPKNKQSPRDVSGSSEFGKSSSRSTRSPAASRARRKNNQSSGRRSASLNRESSTDEMSIQSDISRSELKSKLKEEALSRKREEELVRELQSNYDSLLMKFAQAENTIDHLRLGAKINIFATVPRPSPDEPTLPFEEGQLKHQQQQQQQHHNIQEEQVNPNMFSGNHYHQSSTGSFAPSSGSKRDSLVESSLQLPAAATTEFLKVALQLQAKDLQNKIDNFNTLMDNMELEPEELQQAMNSITEALRNLEQDYLNAIDEHAAEQKKHILATGGSMDECQQFDPDRLMERDIGRLGNQVNDLRNRILNQQRSPEPVSARSRVTENEVPSSPEGDVDSKFNQLLHKYNRSALTDDGHTTAASQYLSSQDEDYSPRPLSNRYFEPASAQQDNSVTSQTPRTPVQSPKAQPRRSRYQSSSMGESIPSTSPSPTRRSHSKLPRPVGKTGKEKRPPSRGDKKSLPVDKGTDSGFVGSESSRQSAAATPLQPTRIKLVERPPTAVEVQSPSPQMKPDKRNRAASGDTTSTVTTNDRFPTNRSAPQTSYIDRVGIYKPPTTHDDSLDDLSTTSTVREALRPRHPSRSCSTSTAPSQATTIRRPPFGTFPHGSKSGASLKSRDSGKRSVASSMRDSTLDAIRGEISRLRGEINAAKAHEKENLRPVHSSTPRRSSNGRNSPAVSDNEQLQAIRDDIKALKDELQRKGPKKPSDVDDQSLKSADLTTRRSRDPERGRRPRRSRSLGRDDISEASTHRNDTSPEVEGRQRRRSRSQTRNPWQGGYWTYVPPAPIVTPVWGASQPTVGRTYTRAQSPVPMAPVYPQMVHTVPVIGPPPSMVYVEPRAQAMDPVFIPSAPRPGRLYTTPSKPKASVYISPSRGRSGSVRKASVYIVESDGDEQPLRRSHLGLRRSSSMSRIHTKPSSLVVLPDSRLNDSIERAERSAENLRSHSRQMYRSVRDDLYRTQLLAETM